MSFLNNSGEDGENQQKSNYRSSKLLSRNDLNELDHMEQCECRICEKQKQILEMKKGMKIKFISTSIYRKSFTKSMSSSKSKSKLKSKDQLDFKKEKKGNEKKRNQKELQKTQRVEFTPQKQPHSQLKKLLQKREASKKIQEKKKNLAYLQLNSTYLKDFSPKQSQIVKYRPQDNIKAKRSSLPLSTTYFQSYHSTLTPKPDESMKAFQLPFSDNKMPFKAESTYKNSFRGKLSKPSLPIINYENIHLPKALYKFESTQRDSYRSLENPQKNQMIKPSNTIVQLPAFAHNYDTTYRNMFLSSNKKKNNDLSKRNQRHDINFMGNINLRNMHKNNSLANKTIVYKKI